VAGGKAFIVRDGKAVDAATGAAATLPSRCRGRGQQQPHAPRAGSRAGRAASCSRPTVADAPRKAIAELKDQADEGKLVLIDKADRAETDADLKAALELLRAGGPDLVADKAKRLAAAKLLAGSERAGHAVAAAGAPGPSETDPKVQGRAAGVAGHRAGPAGLGRAPGRAVHRRQPGLASCCWWRWAWPSPTA
jgi:hypothetical protein